MKEPKVLLTMVDSQRLQLFKQLHASLQCASLPYHPDRATGLLARANISLYDAIFSCAIEGIDFDVYEATGVLFRGEVQGHRTSDCCDLRSLFEALDDHSELRERPTTFQDFVGILKGRHAYITACRPEIQPGTFKSRNNRVGTHVFVDPASVLDTLHYGYGLLESLVHPLARGLFAHFLIAEVHPFNDGNGRLARLMMNADLVSSRQCRIIIPPVYKQVYLSALSGMSRHQDVDTYIRVMTFAQELVHSIDFSQLEATRHNLWLSNAFQSPYSGSQLLLP